MRVVNVLLVFTGFTWLFTQICKILTGRGWRQSAQAKCKKTGCANVSGNNRSSCPTIVSRIKSQGLEMNNKVMMPQVLKSKCIIFQQCFEVSDSDFSNCMSKPIQIEFDVTFPVCETVSLIYKEGKLGLACVQTASNYK